ncbi:hypothetical protein ACS0TY_015498 [Phlomoides rotata]
MDVDIRLEHVDLPIEVTLQDRRSTSLNILSLFAPGRSFFSSFLSAPGRSFFSDVGGIGSVVSPRIPSRAWWERCLVHRDIKASNVMLDSNFNAKLGDFGLATLVDHEKGSQTTLMAGTMGYLAPECAVTGRTSKESDVYSFWNSAIRDCMGKKSYRIEGTRGPIIGGVGVGHLQSRAVTRCS